MSNFAEQLGELLLRVVTDVVDSHHDMYKAKHPGFPWPPSVRDLVATLADHVNSLHEKVRHGEKIAELSEFSNHTSECILGHVFGYGKDILQSLDLSSSEHIPDKVNGWIIDHAMLFIGLLFNHQCAPTKASGKLIETTMSS